MGGTLGAMRGLISFEQSLGIGTDGSANERIKSWEPIH